MTGLWKGQERQMGKSVSLLKTGSAFYSPSLGAVAMAEANLKDKKTDFPLLCLFRGNPLQ